MLQIHAIHTFYGESHILHGVDLHIEAGQSVGLLGRNGMGKTTLIRSLMGYLPVTSGSIEWRGTNVTGLPPERMARLGIGYVPEGRGIFPNLSVRENLIMSARTGISGRQDWTYDRVLETFPRLKERLTHGGQQLSGGEQQMVAIGRALMTNPELMVLDEATEGLAPLIVKDIWRVIREIGESGISTLIVDRNFRTVLAQTDRAVIIEKGCIVLAGNSAELAGSEAALKQYLGV
ncbi:ABC transporter ATP-binding protein [Herbaspirillum sp. RTI4]|uniref:ABC transporter ATP-binding protein n=1 Tax=Herbaspirillum sp. RTI4 TaxID=3048640 RepID=UPI002AB495EE|nr:ABC transporter ATP-binding protein [Herbaspirillum sp. RTI4]MDY7578407.1 ABC transporter ATP-binding protein [Herbaspirillum sp. RTI4]MEA9982579.1 ABC transporter ATP-binding protein [Herbaspirillum sp. RTI4]